MQLTELMNLCTKLSNRVLSLEQINTNQAVKINKLKKRVKKLKGKKRKRTHGLKRMYKVGLSARIVSSNEEDGDEVIMDVTTGENVEQDATVAEKEVSTAAGELVTTAEGVEDQIALDEEVSRKLEAQMKAEMEEEERIAREKDEANIAIIKEWDDVQATIDADKRITKIDADKDLFLIDEAAQDQGRMNEEEMFGVDDLDGDEVIMDVTTGENVEQDATVAEKEVSTAAGELVTTA
nr:hypothetical protein [Tanacetum cinerariifolium]